MFIVGRRLNKIFCKISWNERRNRQLNKHRVLWQFSTVSLASDLCDSIIELSPSRFSHFFSCFFLLAFIIINLSGCLSLLLVFCVCNQLQNYRISSLMTCTKPLLLKRTFWLCLSALYLKTFSWECWEQQTMFNVTSSSFALSSRWQATRRHSENESKQEPDFILWTRHRQSSILAMLLFNIECT